MVAVVLAFVVAVTVKVELNCSAPGGAVKLAAG
jgi:hypothetical protein